MARLPKNKQNHVFAMARRRARVAELYLSGKTQQQIAGEVGVSQMTVSTDLAALRKAWLASALRDFEAMKAEELARLAHLEREAWEAWHRSCQDAVAAHKETESAVSEAREAKKLASKGEEREVLVSVGVIQKRTTRGQPGDPRYLASVFRCVEARLKVLGVLDGPTTRTDAAAPNWDELVCRPHVSERSDAALGAARADV